MSSVFRWTHGQYYAEVEDRKQELKRYLIFLIWFHFNVVSYFPVSLKLYIMLMLKRPLNLKLQRILLDITFQSLPILNSTDNFADNLL